MTEQEMNEIKRILHEAEREVDADRYLAKALGAFNLALRSREPNDHDLPGYRPIPSYEMPDSEKLGKGIWRQDAVAPPTSKSYIDPMNESPSRPEIDAKLAAAEARTETRFIEMRGDIQKLTATVGSIIANIKEVHDDYRAMSKTVSSEAKSTRSTMIVTALASVFAILSMTFALVYGEVQISKAQESNLLSAFQAGSSLRSGQ